MREREREGGERERERERERKRKREREREREREMGWSKTPDNKILLSFLTFLLERNLSQISWQAFIQSPKWRYLFCLTAENN